MLQSLHSERVLPIVVESRPIHAKKLRTFVFLRVDLYERMRANEHDSGLRISLQLNPGAWLGLPLNIEFLVS